MPHPSVLSGNGKMAGALSAVYVENALQYHTPRFGGFQAQFEYAPNESSAAGGNDGMGVGVRYDGGPISASFVNYKGAKAGGAKQKAVNQLGLAYDFGVAKAFFTYRDQGGLASNEDTSYALGVTAPVGPGSLYASYNVNERVGSDGRTLIAGYKYSLSKRTTAYVNIANRNAAWLNAAVVANGGKANSSSTGFGVGLEHNF